MGKPALQTKPAIRLSSRLVKCHACEQPVQLRYEMNNVPTATVAWTCPYTQACGRMNHTTLPGTLIGVGSPRR